MSVVLRLSGAVWVTIVFLAASIALSVAVALQGGPLPGDRDIISWVQDRTLPGQLLSDALRGMSGSVAFFGVGFVAAAALWLRGKRRGAVVLIGALVALAVVSATVKEAVDQPRPGPPDAEVRSWFETPSFPSGHVMNGTFLYGYLAYLSFTLPLAAAVRRGFLALCVAIIVLNGPANVWVGVHWPSDALGGWLWGLTLLLAAIAVDRSWLFAREDPLPVSSE
jgi:membrane-associated phospholipid phosphatase